MSERNRQTLELVRPILDPSTDPATPVILTVGELDRLMRAAVTEAVASAKHAAFKAGVQAGVRGAALFAGRV